MQDAIMKEFVEKILCDKNGKIDTERLDMLIDMHKLVSPYMDNLFAPTILEAIRGMKPQLNTWIYKNSTIVIEDINAKEGIKVVLDIWGKDHGNGRRQIIEIFMRDHNIKDAQARGIIDQDDRYGIKKMQEILSEAKISEFVTGSGIGANRLRYSGFNGIEYVNQEKEFYDIVCDIVDKIQTNGK